MTKRITPGAIKKENRRRVYDYIYRNKDVSQQDISAALSLSRPTIATNLNELEDDGLIYKSGFQESEQIGRKAVTYSIVSDYRVSIGVEIMHDKSKILAIDLYGVKINRIVYKIPYKNTSGFCKKICDCILEFITETGLTDTQILGVGFAMQGLTSPEGDRINYGAILDNTGLTIDSFSRYLRYPCRFIHDPDGAALTELWYSPELTDALYLSLSEHFGGALIANGKIHPGKHGHSATFEHIQLVRENGKRCYCGRYGCAETLLSMKALVGDHDPDLFFEKVSMQTPGYVEKWKQYLEHLAHMIYNLHLVCDTNLILGGHLAPYFTEADIEFMYDEIVKMNPFTEPNDFIHMGRMPSHNITIGAALPYINDFLQGFE